MLTNLTEFNTQQKIKFYQPWTKISKEFKKSKQKFKYTEHLKKMLEHFFSSSANLVYKRTVHKNNNNFLRGV